MISHALYKFEQEVIDTLLERMEKNEISEDRLKEIASGILTEFPSTISDKEIGKKITGLGQKYPELSSIVVNYGKDTELKQKNKVSLDKVHNLMKTGKVDDATEMIKNLLNKYG